MQELQFVPDDSDAASLVLRATGSDGSDALYWVQVTDDLRRVLRAPADPAAANLDVDHSGAEVEPAQSSPSKNTQPTSPNALDVPDVREAPDASEASATSDVSDSERTVVLTPVRTAGDSHRRAAAKEKLRLRPRDIQKRLRHGATVSELAEETGLPESRFLPYAHPIDMERARIAELSRQAYPVRSDGPAEHTLWEVLATAFGARGEDVRAALWDASMDSSDSWVVSISWTRGNRQGATRFVAEFRWVPPSNTSGGPATVEPVNSVATDLIDPRFNRPVRTMTSVPVAEDESTAEAAAHADDNGAGKESLEHANDDLSDEVAPAVDLFGDDISDRSAQRQSRRRRSAATPHWEDVLLGVRTNPRRKK